MNKKLNCHRLQQVGLSLTLCMLAATIAASPAAAVGTTSYITSDAAADRFPVSTAKQAAPLFVHANDYPGVHRVAKQLQADIGRVTDHKPELAIGDSPIGEQVVLIGTLGKSPIIDRLVAAGKLDKSKLEGKWEKFIATVVDSPLEGVDRALVIAGSDKRGTIYGMYDLSHQIGVSPWYWWADVPDRKQQELYAQPGEHTLGEPAVKYRGIFINDEAPALSGWMAEKFGGHNHKLYDHVFELILRLRGNYLWPAMWGRSIYEDDPQSPELADEYGVVIATSHHEPMMRAHVDWERNGKGAWNYDTNEATLREFWREGIERMGDNESVITVGMRGDGDEPMSESANIALLERIVADQRKIIGEVTGKDPAEVPQVWALYKEVQEYYDKGMRVPDDITLLLCDDNWGNIRKLPQLGERPRRGGYGIYYHFDYVGGPRNYKWLNTNMIPRIWEQMHLAYEYGVRRLWIVNVGDIKPMEFPTEFFLDYAWDPTAWPASKLDQYTRDWAAEQFGDEHADAIADILAKYTRYNARRKPELLDQNTYSLQNYREAERIVEEYNQLLQQAEAIEKQLPAEDHDAYFQLVLHPVKACANLNELYLTVAKNRLYAKQGRAATNDLAARTKELFDNDAAISRYYNEELADGKWSHMMDQTHIGYTYWQQPDKDVMPRVEKIDVPEKGELAVAVEGSDSWWPSESDSATLPVLNSLDQNRAYIEVFNRGRSPLEFTVESAEPWVKVEVDPASDEELGKLEKQQRLWVSVDWEQAPPGRHQTPITITSPDGEQIIVQAIANKLAPPADFQGFVETDGYVSIEAENFSKAVAAQPIDWLKIPNYGRTHSGVTPVPVTADKQTPGGDSPHLEYRVLLSQAGPVKVDVHMSPTLDFHNTGGRRYAISFDDQRPQMVNVHGGETSEVTPSHAGASNRDWEKWVAENVIRTTSEHQLDSPGEHVLKFWMVDPGLVLEKIVIDAGGLKPSYLGPPESPRWPAQASSQR